VILLMLSTYFEMDHDEDALSVQQEAVSLYRTLIADGQDEFRSDIADALYNCGNTHFEMGHLEEALKVVSLYRTLAADGQGELRSDLANALHDCAHFLLILPSWSVCRKT
jgi:hypothetical protein